MIIKKDWHFQLRDKKTKEITCSVLFRIVDDKRKVDVNTTGLLICEIKRWIKIYKEKIIPSLNKNDKKYQEIKDNVSYWGVYKDYLIPENRSPFKDDFTKQHFVKLNYQLLESNKLLNYNQALFLLLGLDSTELDHSMRDFPVLDKARPTNVFEFIFWNTEQNQMLKTSAYLQNRKISSENLLDLADKYNFFVKPKHTSKSVSNRIYPKWLSKGLHDYLTAQGLIKGEYNQMWAWTPKYKNSLGYLADELSSNFKVECPVERKQPNLTAYIEYSGAKFHKMGESKNYETRDKIDIVISKLNELNSKS
jgi:hypothetical protein